MRVGMLRAAAAVLAAAWFGLLIVGCNSATDPSDDEFGSAELIYEINLGFISHAVLTDTSYGNEMYIIAGNDEINNEHGLWYIEPPESEIKLIISRPSWWLANSKLSPDKGNVVFEEKSGIYVVPVSGGEPRRVYGQGLDPTPAQWIDEETFLMYVGEETWKIKTVNINTLDVVTLFSVPIGAGDVRDISLSPDGKYLFLTGERQEGDEWSSSYYFFQVYDTETWEYEEHRTDCFGNGPWSPDGSKVSIFGSYPYPYSGYKIYKYFDFATGEEVPVFYSTKLVFNAYHGGIWNPDGKHFLASEDRDDNILRVFAVDVE
jgi:WD40 repeat protein